MLCIWKGVRTVDIADFYEGMDRDALFAKMHEALDGAGLALAAAGCTGDTLQQEKLMAALTAGMQCVLTQYHEWLVANILGGASAVSTN